MTMRVYPDYRDSGVEWLGDMPEHWAVTRLRDVAELINGYPFDSELFDQYQGIPLVRIRDLFTLATEVKWSGDPVPAAEIGDGDILIGMDGDFNVAWWTHGPALLNQRLCCARALSEVTSQRFLFYCLPFPLKALNEVTYATTVKHLSSLDVLKFRLPLPPPHEQRAIASFLDRETERIDGLTEKKRLLIERLEEYRTALITRTVTRGLPPEAARAAGLDTSPRLKASGVEWLGSVPAHWNVQPLRSLVALRGGATPDKSREEFWDGRVPWVSPKDMKQASLSDSQDHVTEAAVATSSVSLLPVGSVLVVVRGMILAHSLPVAITTAPVTINQDIKALLNEDSISNRFLYWCLVGMGDAVVSLCDESAHGTRKLDTETLVALPIPVPPVEEQQAIAAFLDHQARRIDRLRTTVELAVERFEEYRTAVITAAVTGKIDVRAQAPTRVAAA